MLIDNERILLDNLESVVSTVFSCMAEQPPKVVILAGPNGAGKSTAANKLLLGALKVDEFVNADTIATGLSAFAPERVAFEAGRIALARLEELANARASFAFETTLSARSYAPWLKALQATGYEFHLFFLWLPSADMSIARVAERVRSGGHNVPEETIRRRYEGGLANLRTLYIPLANSWQLIDNTRRDKRRLIASGGLDIPAEVYSPNLWRRIMRLEK